jgi:hypothetical protein
MKNEKTDFTSPNRTVCASPLKRLGFRKTPVGLSALYGILLHHIFSVAEMLRISLSQPQKRRIQPERYAQ